MVTRFTLDEVFAMAEEIERNGARFYRRAAKLAAEPEHRRHFEELAAWEGGHERLFQQLRAQLVTPDQDTSTVYDPHGEVALYLGAMAAMHVFRRDLPVDALVEQAGDTRRILALALDFERDSIAFFLGMKAAVPEGPGRAGVDRLIAEEMGHVAYLSRLQAGI